MHSTVESDQSSCFSMSKSGFAIFYPIILELDKSYVFVEHEKHALSDSYIVEFVHDATENYYERGKYGCWNSHVTKKPLFILKVLKLLLFYLPILVTMCFFDLFSYKIPMHRKWFRFKYVSYLLFDALSYFKFLYGTFALSSFRAPTWASLQTTAPSSKALKKSTLGR